MKPYYITTSGKTIEYNASSIVILINKHIKEITLPDNANFAVLNNNPIQSLTLPISLSTLRCDFINGIEEQNRKDLRIFIKQKK
jgi:hypothetical protein